MFPFIEFYNIKISTFPLLILLALLITGIEYIKSPLYPKIFLLDIMRKVIPVLLGAAIGARLMSAIILTVILDRPFWYNVLFGGAVFYGGFIGGCISLAIVCWIKKQPFLEYTDVFVSLLPLGHAIGRVACYFNGCCYGCRYDGIFAVYYPIDGEFVKVFPTWFVEALFCIALFVFFRFICRARFRGRRTAIYFIAYSNYRFLIEFVRGDKIRGTWGVLTTSQIISVFTLNLGLIVLFYSNITKKHNYMVIKEKELNETRGISTGL